MTEIYKAKASADKGKAKSTKDLKVKNPFGVENPDEIWDSMKKDANGFVPSIVQDSTSGEVLMLAYMNGESFKMTVLNGYAHYFSRSRNKLWKKGETSGNTQEVIEIKIDCDLDTILLIVKRKGPACHTGEQSCFYRKIDEVNK